MNIKKAYDFHSLWRHVVFTALGAVAAWIIHYGTAVAPWAYSDGVGYMVSARNLIEGPGLGLVKPSGQFEPLVTHPPLYPLMLAAGRNLGLDVLTGARWIGVGSFALLVALAGWLTAKITDRFRTGLSVSLLLMVSPQLVLLFLAAMAEPVFLLSGILSLLLLALGLRTESRLQLTLSAILAGVSALSRYPGLVFVLTGGVVLLVQRTALRQRLKDALQFTALGAAPVAAFLAVSSWLRQAGAPRWLAPPGLQLGEFTSFIQQALQVLWTWKPLPTAAVLEALSPGAGKYSDWAGASLVLLVCASVLGYVWVNRAQIHRPAMERAASLAVICGAFTLLYLGFLLGAFLFTSPTPDVDFRTVLPVLPAFLIGTVAWLDGLSPDLPSEPRKSKVLFGLLITVVLVGYLPSTVELLIGHHRTGAGYTARAWQTSGLVTAVGQLDPDQPLISNAPEGLLLYSDRFPYDLKGLTSGHQGDCIGEGKSRVDTLYRDQGAALVLVSAKLPGGNVASASAAIEEFNPMPCEAHALYTGSDGMVLVHPDVVR